MIKMPWYTDPVATCKVLDKIAKRYDNTTLHDLKSVLDDVVSSILRKQMHYFEDTQQQ
jgi:hypothetical protein